MTAESESPVLPKQPSLVAEVARTLVIALLIVLGVRTFLWQPFNIPTGSMVDTLLVGDYVMVSKYAYGYSRHTLPFSLPLFEGRIFGSLPERGDVVVFKLPSDNSTDYIKRVVGLPGDRIQMRQGVLYINGEAARQELLGEVDAAADRFGGKRYRETLPGGRSHDIIDKYPASEGDNTAEFVVPEDHLFMLGDNRDDSTDSRFAPKGTPGGFGERPDGVGFVPVENLVGRAEDIFFSADGSAGFLEVWKWGSAVRWERIFRSLQ